MEVFLEGFIEGFCCCFAATSFRDASFCSCSFLRASLSLATTGSTGFAGRDGCNAGDSLLSRLPRSILSSFFESTCFCGAWDGRTTCPRFWIFSKRLATDMAEWVASGVERRNCELREKKRLAAKKDTSFLRKGARGESINRAEKLLLGTDVFFPENR